MKKRIIIACAAMLLLSNSKSLAQADFITSPYNANHIVTSGGSDQVGIQDWNPQDPLTINGNLGFTQNGTPGQSGTGFYNNIIGRSLNFGLGIFSNYTYSEGAAMALMSKPNGGFIDFVVPNDAQTINAFNFKVYTWAPPPSPGTWDTKMTILRDGKVLIGNAPTNTAHSYGLYVENGVLTSKVKVALPSDPTNWSDFVFADDYQLRSLGEVEEFIKENKHLPEIPSTEEVHKEGLDLAQMDAKLLQKIEELTLYVIEQNKKIDNQQKEIKRLKNR